MKSKERKGNLGTLRKFFEGLRKYQMRLNLQKCTFGVIFGKLLGFLITHMGIEVDPAKIKAITDMQLPKNEKEARGCLGRVQFISRFIYKITMTCYSLFRLLRKGGGSLYGIANAKKPSIKSKPTFKTHLSFHHLDLINLCFFTYSSLRIQWGVDRKSTRLNSSH